MQALNKIPPLNPLHVFEVAARLGSFTLAAEELNVTQSAVSRQIATLEGAIGVRLFQRTGRGAQLTRAGEEYLPDISQAFALIGAATDKLTQSQKVEPLHILVYTTFAAKWLIRRLPDFQARYPALNVRIHNSTRPVNFARDNIDLAIQLGSGFWPKMNSMRLFSDVIQPVASPLLLKNRKKPLTIDSLSQFQMLHSRYRRNDWSDWLNGVGRPDLISNRGMEYPSSVMTYGAAIEGLGIAIGQVNLLDQDFKSGLLVPLFDKPITRDLAYYAVWPDDREPARKVRSFLNWLGQIIEKEQD